MKIISCIQVSELDMVKSGIQGLKAEKIILEEKVANLSKELQACKKEIGKFLDVVLDFFLFLIKLFNMMKMT